MSQCYMRSACHPIPTNTQKDTFPCRPASPFPGKYECSASTSQEHADLDQYPRNLSHSCLPSIPSRTICSSKIETMKQNAPRTELQE
ncbi:hypothetical protein VTL71DRAFT_5689 [Oculimacula yallundae]|uniref:Uncharacterized protein n=1 Tax=Oculimacula yallundae TaxID=86028 RepID=A0ABR4BYB9_9HELO